MYVDDDSRLRHIRDVAREALDFVGRRPLAEFAGDRLAQHAVAACLTTLGEAAAKLTPRARAPLGKALSPRVTSTYDRLLAGDYQTQPALLWEIVTSDLPTLCAALDRALAVPTAAQRARADARPRSVAPRVATDPDQIAAFCERHRIRRLALFGSVLRDDFRPDSDVDVLVEFEPDTPVSLFDMVDLEHELEAIVGRRVDLREPEDLSRYFRQRVLDAAEVLYERA